MLNRPGPYVFEQFRAYYQWVVVPPGATAPPIKDSCRHVPWLPKPLPLSAEAPFPSGDVWVTQSVCLDGTTAQFDVLGRKGDCGHGVDYINQYEANGLRKDQHGESACGPSSLRMAIDGQLARAKGPPSLATLYKETLNGNRDFDGNKAVRYLKQQSWKKARLMNLPSGQPFVQDPQADTATELNDPSNEVTIDEALKKGPVVLSTAFSQRPWGTAGNGHIILCWESILTSLASTSSLIPPATTFPRREVTTGLESAATECSTPKTGSSG